MTKMEIGNAFEERSSNGQMQEAFGIHYVAGAAPRKGTKVAADGSCEWVLECYRIDDSATPGEIAGTVFNPKHAKFLIFNGSIAFTRHDAGMMLDQVYNLKGTTTPERREGNTLMLRHVTDFQSLMCMSPKVGDRPSNKPHFGRAARWAMPYEQETKIWEEIANKRSAQSTKTSERGCVIKGM